MKLLLLILFLALALDFAEFTRADDSGPPPPTFPSHMEATPPPPGPKVHVIGIPNRDGTVPGGPALSPDEGSQMGVGIQFHFGGGPEPTPTPSKKTKAQKKKKHPTN